MLKKSIVRQNISEILFTFKWLKWTKLIQSLLYLNTQKMLLFHIWSSLCSVPFFFSIIHVFYTTVSLKGKITVLSTKRLVYTSSAKKPLYIPVVSFHVFNSFIFH